MRDADKARLGRYVLTVKDEMTYFKTLFSGGVLVANGAEAGHVDATSLHTYAARAADATAVAAAGPDAAETLRVSGGSDQQAASENDNHH